MQDPVKALPKEGVIHALGAAPQIQLYLDTVAFFEPCGCLACLELEVVVARTYLDLDGLGLGRLGATFGLLSLFLLLVLVFAVLHELTDGRLGHRSDLDQVEALVVRHSKCLCNRKYPEVCTFCINDANFGCTDLVVDSFLHASIVGYMSVHHTEKELLRQTRTKQIRSLSPVGNREVAGFSGKFLIYKERGETLAVLVKRFRAEQGITNDVPVTYAGRLDPMAEGVVLLLAGEDRHKKDEYLKLTKTYEIEVLFGISTDTGDMLGLIADERYRTVEPGVVENALLAARTLTELPYPMYSSVLVDGMPLFVHARAGNTVTVPTKKVTISEAKLLRTRVVPVELAAREAIESIGKVEGDFRQTTIMKQWQKVSETHRDKDVLIATIRITASSGTYMRSLAHWIGDRLNMPALAYTIKRTKLGEWSV